MKLDLFVLEVFHVWGNAVYGVLISHVTLFHVFCLFSDDLKKKIWLMHVQVMVFFVCFFFLKIWFIYCHVKFSDDSFIFAWLFDFPVNFYAGLVFTCESGSIYLLSRASFT